MIFDNAFFENHQRAFLVLLNLPLVGQVMRRALWMEDYFYPVTKITPIAYHVWTGWKKYKAVLYSNPQYAEAMHRSFGWLWQLAHWWDAVVANPLRPEWNLGFDTYSRQPDDTTGVDTYIRSDTPTVNSGTSTTSMWVGEYFGATAIFRTLIKFDFSSLASPLAIPSSATLSLWAAEDRSNNARTFRVYRTKRDWVEAEATWNIWKTSNNWSTAGGFHADDCEQTAIASRDMTATEAVVPSEKQWTNFDLTLLQDMWDGDWTNNGWLIKADTETDDAYRFVPSGHATAGERPKMVIVYTAGTAYTQAVAGTLTTAGTLTKKTKKAFTGTLYLVGIVTRKLVNLFVFLRALSRDRVLTVEARDRTLTAPKRDRVITVPPRNDD